MRTLSVPEILKASEFLFNKHCRWSPGTHPTNTVHVNDVAGAAWACAEWMAPLGRKEADILAGEIIIFHNDKHRVKEVEGMVPHTQKVVAPVFNLVGNFFPAPFFVCLFPECRSMIRRAPCSVWDKLLHLSLVPPSSSITWFSTPLQRYSRRHCSSTPLFDFLLQFKLEDVVEEINEHHVGGWTEMITSSQPPVPKTPLSAYMDKYALSKHVLAYDNTKIMEIVGYKLKQPEFNHAVIKEVVDKWKEEGSWPVLEGN
jgi:hypothetical protein